MRVPDAASQAADWCKTVYRIPEYRDAVERSIAKTKIYKSPFIGDDDKRYFKSNAAQNKSLNYHERTEVVICPTNVVAERYADDVAGFHCMAFATDSYDRPCSSFLGGKNTVEANLCKVSGIYNVQIALQEYTDRSTLRSELPGVILSPRVPFSDKSAVGLTTKVDVLLYSVPELSVTNRWACMQNVYNDMESLYFYPYLNGADTLIVFPESFEKAYGTWLNRIFGGIHKEWRNLYKKVIYVVSDNELFDRYKREV